MKHGFVITGALALLWIWLAMRMLLYAGVTLYNIFVLVASAIIIFVPLWRKYFRNPHE